VSSAISSQSGQTASSACSEHVEWRYRCAPRVLVPVICQLSAHRRMPKPREGVLAFYANPRGFCARRFRGRIANRLTTLPSLKQGAQKYGREFCATSCANALSTLADGPTPGCPLVSPLGNCARSQSEIGPIKRIGTWLAGATAGLPSSAFLPAPCGNAFGGRVIANGIRKVFVC
jgi:hypothetical protein